jgi:hypothetical protein
MLAGRSTTHPSISVASPNVLTYATPAPAMPRRGIGPQPSTSDPDSGRWMIEMLISASAGVSVLPVPRSIEENVFASQTSVAPANTMCE